MKRKRILHEIRLDRIAAVDDPCQEGARAVLMKGLNADVREIFNSRVAEIAKRDRIPRHRAMSKARREHPEIFAAMQTSAVATPSRQLEDAPEVPEARTAFMSKVADLQNRGTPRHAAMTRVRRENPDEFAAAFPA